MKDKITQLQKFTIEEFHKNFDNLINRVENGESFIITSGHRNAIVATYKEVVNVFEDDELIRIHTDHEEGS